MRDRSFYTRHVTQSSVASAPEQTKTVTPHIKRAYLLNNLLNEYKAQVDSLGAVIANAGFGVVLATPEGQIVYANDVAETLMRLRRGLCCRQGPVRADVGLARHRHAKESGASAADFRISGAFAEPAQHDDAGGCAENVWR